MVTLGVPALMMGMVVTLAAIEPAKEGRLDVRAGNLVDTLLDFAHVNLGLIALLTLATAWQKGVASPRTSGSAGCAPSNWVKRSKWLLY